MGFFCAIPSPAGARTVHLDAVAPLAVCLALAALQIGSLDKREMKEYRNVKWKPQIFLLEYKFVGISQGK